MVATLGGGGTWGFCECGLFGLKPVLGGGAPRRVAGTVEEGGDARGWRVMEVSPGEEKKESYGDEEKEETKERL